MKIIYDTVSDRLSVEGLDSRETKILDAKLSEAIRRNDPIMAVATAIMSAAQNIEASRD